MINLSESCIKCNHQQWNNNKKMICGITNNPIHFEDSCNLFEVNKELQQKLENETKNKIKYNYASTGTRVKNYALDLLIIGFIEFIIAVILLIFSGINSKFYSFLFIDDIGKALLMVSLNIIYYTIFEATTGKTIGKYITKTKVINQKGENPEWTIILLRSVCRFIPFDALSFLGSEEKGWHDTLSKTLVIQE